MVAVAGVEEATGVAEEETEVEEVELEAGSLQAATSVEKRAT